ncbi:hypothetical protein M422DRAFT_87315, partial [Sphaerobolus stellatus SS14]
YKPVDRKVKPVPTMMPDDTREFSEDPLTSLPSISLNPPPIKEFSRRLMEEHWYKIKMDREFLIEEELKLSFQVLKNNEGALAWDDSERGTFQEDYLEPVVIPTVEHEPWAQKVI